VNTSFTYTEDEVRWAAWCLAGDTREGTAPPMPKGWAFMDRDLEMAKNALARGYKPPAVNVAPMSLLNEIMREVDLTLRGLLKNPKDIPTSSLSDRIQALLGQFHIEWR